MTQFNDHNFEELDGVYTRPTLDLYLLNKYWAFLTNGAAKEEVAPAPAPADSKTLIRQQKQQETTQDPPSHQ